MDNATKLLDEKLAAEPAHPELIGIQPQENPMRTLSEWLMRQ
jgi:hypothetical protein